MTRILSFFLLASLAVIVGLLCSSAGYAEGFGLELYAEEEGTVIFLGGMCQETKTGKLECSFMRQKVIKHQNEQHKEDKAIRATKSFLDIWVNEDEMFKVRCDYVKKNKNALLNGWSGKKRYPSYKMPFVRAMIEACEQGDVFDFFLQVSKMEIEDDIRTCEIVSEVKRITFDKVDRMTFYNVDADQTLDKVDTNEWVYQYGPFSPCATSIVKYVRSDGSSIVQITEKNFSLSTRDICRAGNYERIYTPNPSFNRIPLDCLFIKYVNAAPGLISNFDWYVPSPIKNYEDKLREERSNTK